MNEQKFSAVAATPANPDWEQLTSREQPLYDRPDDIRSPFMRDYTRILHSTAYRRLKHKTQVFFNTDNDHICTRMEHVSHVESVSASIAIALGLNEELTRAISMGHDLGHAPFGHQGEVTIRELSEQYLKKDFWHEQNGLRFVDNIELLEDSYRVNQNLNLTYAVRDGILSHCGEVDQNGIKPRGLDIPIQDFDKPGKYQAITWEGCVVKMADKIAYVGRDIEDAISLGILSDADQEELHQMAGIFDRNVVNTTVIMHNMILDICKNSDPKQGILLSPCFAQQLETIKTFNYEHIYHHKRLEPYVHYSELVIKEIFHFLYALYDDNLWKILHANHPYAPTLVSTFEGWLAKFTLPEILPEYLRTTADRCNNRKIYGSLQTETLYAQAIIDYISGMTDRFAITVFNELLTFGFRE